MVTIKQIADMCGVSRGTVDRVLNNRGNVKPEKKELILSIAKKLNYTPNPVGKALAARKNHTTIGVVMPSVGIKFFDAVIDAMKKTAKLYEAYGLDVIWNLSRGYDVDVQCKTLDEFKNKVTAVIINPILDQRVRDKLTELSKAGVQIVTLNNDIDGIPHHWYVGSDYISGGSTAAALLSMIGPKNLNVGVIMGSHKALGHRQRLEGFKNRLAMVENAEICDICEDNDDDICSYEQTRTSLTKYPKINALFVLSSGGVYGVCRAVMALKRKDITIVAFDTVSATIEMMEQGVIAAALYQHPRRQGQKAMQILFDFLVNGIDPDTTQNIMTNEIRILENVNGGFEYHQSDN